MTTSRLSKFFDGLRGLFMFLYYYAYIFRLIVAKIVRNGKPRAPGKFTNKIIEWFMTDGVIRGGKQTYYLLGETFEHGDDPLHEEIRISFKVYTEPIAQKMSLREHTIESGRRSGSFPASRGLKPKTLYYVVFTSGWSIKKNLEHLRQFVIQQEEEVGHNPPHTTYKNK